MNELDVLKGSMILIADMIGIENNQMLIILGTLEKKDVFVI